MSALSATMPIGVKAKNQLLGSIPHPYVYFPLHGPTVGNDPASSGFEERGYASSNGGTQIFQVNAGVLPVASGSVPAGAWTDTAGMLTGQGASTSAGRISYTTADGARMRNLVNPTGLDGIGFIFSMGEGNAREIVDKFTDFEVIGKVVRGARRVRIDSAFSNKKLVI